MNQKLVSKSVVWDDHKKVLIVVNNDKMPINNSDFSFQLLILTLKPDLQLLSSPC